MYLAKELLHQLSDPNLSTVQRARLRCQLAQQLELAGNFELAREAMGELWQQIGDRPLLEGLDEETEGQVLLRAGALTGYIGSANQVPGSQEMAKNLISESYARFQRLENSQRVAEAQIEIAVCYWREGSFDEARVMLQEAISKLDDTNMDLRAIALIRIALVETFANRLHDAFRIQNDSAVFFEAITNDVLKGKFHHLFGSVLDRLATAEQRQDYRDRALIEYTAASFYFEQARLSRYQACVENNLGFLFGKIGKFAEAHEHLDHAQALFTSLKDKTHLAQVDETRARVMLAEGRVSEAEKMVRVAVRIFESSGEQSLLAEALTTQGIALARLDDKDKAYLVLERATKLAEHAGDPESAGEALLVMIEELRASLSGHVLNVAVEHACELLENSQDMAKLKRLINCTRHTISSARLPASVDWANFSFNDAVLRYEAHIIKLALRDSGGAVTRAAHLLGFKHHQSLISLLNGRHKALRFGPKPIAPRRRSIMRKLDTSRSRASEIDSGTRTVRILHVEDNRTVAEAVKETLELEGWEVETCTDGAAALKKILDDTHYDLLLLDYDLPGVSGIELVRRARSVAHRENTPIIVLSAALGEAEAREAGANEFLHKPEDIRNLVETITRLLSSAEDLKT